MKSLTDFLKRVLVKSVADLKATLNDPEKLAEAADYYSVRRDWAAWYIGQEIIAKTVGRYAR